MLNQKKINKAGGVTIPSHLRRAYGIKEGDRFEIQVDRQGDLHLKRVGTSCIFCGSTEVIGQALGKHFCKDCATIVAQGFAKVANERIGDQNDDSRES